MSDEIPARRRATIQRRPTGLTMGIDLALGRTGIIVLEGDVLRHEELIDMEKIGEKGLDRCDFIARRVCAAIGMHGPDAIAVEGYSMASRGVGFLSLVELGGHVRTMIRLISRESGVSQWDVPPATLKKFATGNGTAKKPEMAIAVFKRWGYEAPHSDDNLVDAYALARAARVLSAPSAAKTDRATLAKSSRRS